VAREERRLEEEGERQEAGRTCRRQNIREPGYSAHERWRGWLVGKEHTARVNQFTATATSHKIVGGQGGEEYRGKERWRVEVIHARGGSDAGECCSRTAFMRNVDVVAPLGACCLLLLSATPIPAHSLHAS